MSRLPRPHMSLSVKLAACLDALGFEPGEKIEWDHTFALGLRRRLPDGSYDPPANDPRYIRPKRIGEHAVKTRGNGATTAGSDVGNMRHIRALTASHAEFRSRMLAKSPGNPPPRSGKVKSRGFRKGRSFQQWRG
jgi:hypothetical protein